MDINTNEGMQKAKVWLSQYLSMLKHEGIWFIPRSVACYRVDQERKVLTRVTELADLDTERVAKEIGWRVVK